MQACRMVVPSATETVFPEGRKVMEWLVLIDSFLSQLDVLCGDSRLLPEDFAHRFPMDCYL